jgi:hypothetical protein
MSDNLMALSKLDMDPFDERCDKWTRALETIANGILQQAMHCEQDTFDVLFCCSLLIPDNSYPLLLHSENGSFFMVEMGVKRWPEWVLSAGPFMKVISLKLQAALRLKVNGYQSVTLRADGMNFCFHFLQDPLNVRFGY